MTSRDKSDAWNAANPGKVGGGAGPLFDRVEAKPDGTLVGTGSHPALPDLKPGDTVSIRFEGGAPIQTGYAAGLAGSADAARAWTDAEREAVVRAVEACGRSGREFTSDDVWGLLPHVPVTKGLASVLNAAVRAGKIRNTGRLAIADRGGKHDHSQRLSIWVGC